MRTLTGIQPSGTLHIGNFFGAMRPAIEAQSRGECFYFIADYHSMTSLFDPAERRKNTGYWFLWNLAWSCALVLLLAFCVVSPASLPQSAETARGALRSAPWSWGSSCATPW